MYTDPPENAMHTPRLFPSKLTDDGKTRVAEFLARHGGRGSREEREGSGAEGTEGWSEVCAADGHVLRCDWTDAGGVTHMRFTERRPDPPITSGTR